MSGSCRAWRGDKCGAQDVISSGLFAVAPAKQNKVETYTGDQEFRAFEYDLKVAWLQIVLYLHD